MAEQSAAAASSRASALPAKPPRPNAATPAALSTLEGSGQGFPAGITAGPEALPLTGEAKKGSTSTSTNHPLGLLVSNGSVS